MRIEIMFVQSTFMANFKKKILLCEKKQKNIGRYYLRPFHQTAETICCSKTMIKLPWLHSQL